MSLTTKIYCAYLHVNTTRNQSQSVLSLCINAECNGLRGIKVYLCRLNKKKIIFCSFLTLQLISLIRLLIPRPKILNIVHCSPWFLNIALIKHNPWMMLLEIKVLSIVSEEVSFYPEFPICCDICKYVSSSFQDVCQVG